MKNKILILFNIFAIPLFFCDYTSIKTKRNVLMENLNNSSFLNNETYQDFDNSSQNFDQEGNNPIFTMIKLYNYKDVQYSGDIYVGTPYKKFYVIYDTGSNLFWLPSVNCTLKCRNETNKYDPELSSTSKNLHIKKNISYAKGFIKGKLFKDKVGLNKQSIFSFLYNKEMFVDDFKIIAAYKEKYLFRAIFDGIVGLGINDEGDINNSLIKLLYNQNKISVPSFSFYLLSYKGNNNTNYISRLYIGDILENNYINNLFKNKTKYCYLPGRNDYWMCESQFIKFEKLNTTKTLNSKSGVIFDTGTSYTIIPNNDSNFVMNYFNNTLGKKCFITKFHQIICECNSEKDFGNMKIYFDEENYFLINFEDLIDYNRNFRYQCHFKILMSNLEFGMWVIGDSSLRGNLITFNMKERKINFVQNISEIIDDNKISRSKIFQGRLNSFWIWIIIIIGILAIVAIIYYFFK